ncbi:MAG: serine/threonine-protein kinase [Candidatus Woesearchaeota archaeon]
MDDKLSLLEIALILDCSLYQIYSQLQREKISYETVDDIAYVSLEELKKLSERKIEEEPDEFDFFSYDPNDISNLISDNFDKLTKARDNIKSAYHTDSIYNDIKSRLVIKICEQLQLDGAEIYKESYENLFENFRKISIDQLPFLEYVADIFTGVAKTIYDTEIEEFDAEYLDATLNEWITTIIKLRTTSASKNILMYNIKILSEQIYKSDGVINTCLAELMISWEDNEYYMRFMKEVIDFYEKEKATIKGEKDGINKEDNKRKSLWQLFDIGLLLLRVLNKYDEFTETEYNMAASLMKEASFINVHNSIIGISYLLFLAGNAISSELSEYVSAVMKSQASITAKCYLLQQPVPEAVIEISSDIDRFQEYVKTFEKYVDFRCSLERCLPESNSATYFGITDILNLSSGDVDKNLELITKLLFDKKSYKNSFLIEMRDKLATHHEDKLDSDYYKLLKLAMSIQNSESHGNISDRFHWLYSLGEDFELYYDLNDVLDLMTGVNDDELLIGFNGNRDNEFEVDKYLEQKFRKVVKCLEEGKLGSTAEIIEIANINNPKFTIHRRISSGGFKQVYRATYKEEGFYPEEVALKIYDPKKFREGHSIVSSLIQSIGIDELRKREARIARRLHHDNIASVLDFGSLEDGRFYIAEEFVDGWDLKQFVGNEIHDVKTTIRKIVTEKTAQEKDRFRRYLNISWRNFDAPPIESLEDYFRPAISNKQRTNIVDFTIIYHQIIEGLMYLHKKGFIHRDLKNDNVVVSRDLSVVKITDVQTVIYVDELCEETRGVHGSYNYCAPEVLFGDNPSFASDVYSLGIMMYYSLTGKLPFGPYESTKEAREDHKNKTKHQKRVELMRKKLPTQVINIVTGCLHYEPKKRTVLEALHRVFNENSRLLNYIRFEK